MKTYQRPIWWRFLHALGIVKVSRPWEDPKRQPWERAMWIQAEPKSLRKAG